MKIPLNDLNGEEQEIQKPFMNGMPILCANPSRNADGIKNMKRNPGWLKGEKNG